MPLDIIIGTQWGDEGKGRIVDLLARQANLVVRYNGGDNAGHTVTVADRAFKLHLIPSGIIHAHTTGMLGNGMVINPATLLKEMDILRSAGIEVTPQRLKASYAAHLITPAHLALDQAREASLGKGQIGTTGRGIGPAYTDKATRRGLRLQEMLQPDLFVEKMRAHLQETNHILQALYNAEPLDIEQHCAEQGEFARHLAPYIDDVGSLIYEALSNQARVLAEGAQGTLLDIDHGTYPYVTSSSPTASGALAGMGIGIVPVERIIGVTKAFQSRVGAGPFPTELSGQKAERLRGTGANPWDEFGTTTGRPRRVGWLDGILLKYAVRVNGITELILTKLDILSGIPDLPFCTAYRRSEQVYHQLPMGPTDLDSYEPVYELQPGWEADLVSVRSWQDLPDEARQYIHRIEAIAGVPVRCVSVGPERDQVVDVLR